MSHIEPTARRLSSRSSRDQPLRVLTALWPLLILSQFYRSAIAVIAPDVSRELDLSPQALGILSGAFFVASASMQIPLGVLLDRYGPRRVLFLLLSLTVVGAVVFASARSGSSLTIGQALIGLGCSGVFMGSFVIFARWFAPERFATVTSFSIAVSIAGLLLSATPFAALAGAVGWRAAFVAIGAVTALWGVLAFRVVRDAPAGHPYHTRERETLRATLAGLGEVLRHRGLHRILALAFTSYASVITIRGLWGGPYLADVHGLDALGRGNVLLAMSAATGLGMLAFGPLDRWLDSRKRPILSGGGVAVAALAALALVPAPSLIGVTVLFCVLGGCVAYFGVMMAHGRSLFPDPLMGRAITVINFAAFVGVGLVQVTSGFLVAFFPADPSGARPEEAYRWIFAFLAALLGASLLVYSRARDARPSETPATRV